jgi:hypothetical protein
MRGVLHKLLAFILVAGLIVAGPACSHAQMDPCGSPTSHQGQGVQHYADLNVDPEASSDATASGVVHHHDDDAICKKCCAICVGASLTPTAPVAVVALTASQQMAQVLPGSLAAHSVSIDPGIPKGP